MTKQEYKELQQKIDYHMDRYYNQDTPEISDYEYDQLMITLKKVEAEHPEWITPDSPTQKIGGVAKREAGVKVEHHVPMLSIEDVFTKEEVVEWVNKVHSVHPEACFSVEQKIDGLSMSLRYAKEGEGMRLTLAETRGDGLIGEDVTANALVIPDVKQKLDLSFDYLELRGEVYMSHEDFERYNEAQEEAGKKLAANPRNLAAGTLRQLDTSITAKRGLRMFVFNVQDGPLDFMAQHGDALKQLEELGVPVVAHKICKTAEEVCAAIDEIGESRGELDYDIDGAVVKIDHTQWRDEFEAGSKYSSGHIAYKYPPEEKVIEMDNIIVDVGRTGKLTFTGEFHDVETGKPARLCGTSVSRATLHNQDYINEMQIGIGGHYKLFKSGEIIPKLNGCVKAPEVVFEAPAVCPICGETLVREEDTADIRCVNPSCPAQTVRTISYFASRDAMNIMGLGETLVEALVKNNYLENYADIYELQNVRDELVEKGIVGKEKNTDKLLGEIEKSKNNPPERLLTGLGIRNVGKTTAKSIIRHFHSLEALSHATLEELTAVDDIGEICASSIYDFFHEEQNVEILQRLKAVGLTMEEVDSSIDDKFSGKTFVITGTLTTMKRQEAAALIENHGGKVTGSVSKKTDYLLAGENAGSKLTKANDLGIQVISEEDLQTMLES